jgi:signal transduction histidine kinase
MPRGAFSVTSLRGFTQVLIRQLNRQGQLDPARVGQALDTLEEQSRKLTRLLSQLLDTARIEAGRLALERREINLVSLTQATIAAISLSATAHTIRLNAPDNLPILADPLRLEQALTNLLENAIKFSPSDSVIEVEITSPDAATVRLSITDQGIGIPEESRSQIFNRFYQAHAERHTGGIGLGLYISRQIVELHGGELQAEYPESGGTRFIITLPVGLP